MFPDLVVVTDSLSAEIKQLELFMLASGKVRENKHNTHFYRFCGFCVSQSHMVLYRLLIGFFFLYFRLVMSLF